jgi:HK97 family phage portal protein
LSEAKTPFWRAIFGPRVEEKALSVSEGTWPADLFLAPTASGPSVTPASAMTVPTVSAAVGLISTTVGALPVKVFRKLAEGGKEVDPAHPAYELVHDQANPWTSASKLRETLTADALRHGNGFAYANRVNGRVVEFIRLDPNAVSIVFNTTTGEPAYRVAEGRGFRTYSFGDILHVAAPGYSPDGVSGVSPIHTAREAIGLALTLEAHAARLFGRGARPSGILKFPNKLTLEAATRIRDSWHGAHAGEASGRTAVLEEGGDFQALQFSSVDAQFAELRAFQIEEIARAFRVPSTMLGKLDRATWSNSEEMNRQFLTFCLMPWIKAWEAAFTRVLLSPADRSEISIEFVTDGLLQADTAKRAEAYSKLRSAGILTSNEIRALESRPAHPDGDTLTSPHVTTSPAPSSAPEGSIKDD